MAWAHAVNSRAALNEAVSIGTPYFEADVMIGTHTNVHERQHTTNSLIMAHPPSTSSDLSLSQLTNEFLHFVASTPRISGRFILKLDFKDPIAVEPGLQCVHDCIVQSALSTTNTSSTAEASEAASATAAATQRVHTLSSYSTPKIEIWLNADVLQGPGGAPPRFDPELFIQQCNDFQSQCADSMLTNHIHVALSIGWTTSKLTRTLGYTTQMANEMTQLLVRHPFQHVTFPLSAFHSYFSPPEVISLLLKPPSRTITFWGETAPKIERWITELNKTYPNQIFIDTKPMTFLLWIIFVIINTLWMFLRLLVQTQSQPT
eukprot:m.72150 g.72150  ORF g.72150 m.72150 type:complete len:318 (+) comp12326_c0_seq1:206-1159(+)